MKKTSLKNEYRVDQDFIFGSMTKVGRRSINDTEKISQCRKKSSRHNHSSSPPRLTSKGRCHIGIQCVMPSVPWNPFGFSAKPLRFPRLRVGNKRQPIVPLKEWKLVRGDTVMILGGKDRGKIGKINEVVRSKNWVFVEGLNTHKRYIPPQKGYDGGLTNSEAPLQVSEVSLIDPSDGKPTDITYRFTEKGEKVRVSDRTGRIIPKPPWERRDVKNRSAIKDGDFDTPPSAVTKKTYIPSLLYFHEEIMHALKVPPTIPKTEPDRRDLMMKEVEKAANWHLDTTANAKLSLIDKIYFSVSNYADRLIRFLRIDKL